MAQLDEKGRCCGRKPIVYKGQHSTPEGPQRYCPRCDRAYHLEENWQISNWAYRRRYDGEFVRNANIGSK